MFRLGKFTVPRKLKNEISYENVNEFVRKSYFRHIGIVFIGFFVGARVSGALFFDQNKCLLAQEILENEYWKEFGTPKNFQPEMVPSHVPGKEGQLRPTWIKITLESERYTRKVDPAEFILDPKV